MTTCQVCRHPERDAIDKALVGGVFQKDIAEQYGIGSQMSVSRHFQHHVPERLALAKRAAEVVSADELLAELEDLKSVAWQTVEQARDSGNLIALTCALREVRQSVETEARLLGILINRHSVKHEGAVQQQVTIRTVTVAQAPPAIIDVTPEPAQLEASAA